MNVIDLIALIPLLYFLVNGFNKGVLKEVFNLIGFVLGIIITLQFSDYVIRQIADVNEVSSPLLPVFIYALLFVAVFILVILIGRFIEKILKTVKLNLANRIAGALLGALKAILLISLIMWISDLAGFFNQQVKNESITYKYITKATPLLINLIGEAIPSLKELITNIEHYFSQIALRIDSIN